MMEDLDYIDTYFRETASRAQQEQFEQRIITDPAFAETVAFYLSSLETARLEAIREKKLRFRELYNQSKKHNQPAVIKKLWPYMAAAAVIAGIVFLLTILLNPANPQRLADEYINAQLNRLDPTMGRIDSMQQAIENYNTGKYTVALQQFTSIAQRDTGNTYARIYAGVVSLRLRNYDQAIGYFERLEQRTDLFYNPCTFYHALTLLKRNRPHDKQDARRLLQLVSADGRDSEKKKVADKWLKKLYF